MASKKAPKVPEILIGARVTSEIERGINMCMLRLTAKRLRSLLADREMYRVVHKKYKDTFFRIEVFDYTDWGYLPGLAILDDDAASDEYPWMMIPPDRLITDAPIECPTRCITDDGIFWTVRPKNGIEVIETPVLLWEVIVAAAKGKANFPLAQFDRFDQPEMPVSAGEKGSALTGVERDDDSGLADAVADTALSNMPEPLVED